MRYLIMLGLLSCTACSNYSDRQSNGNDQNQSSSVANNSSQQSSPEQTESNNLISITPLAAVKIKQSLSSTQDQHYLRIDVRGGGCTGFNHIIDIATTVDPNNDITFESQGVPIVIAKKKIVYLRGSVIDWEVKGGVEGIVINNPNEPKATRDGLPKAD